MSESEQASSGTDRYCDLLEAALEAKAVSLDGKSLPELKAEFGRLHDAFRTLLGLLARKGLVEEDPYKNDQKLSEIAVPANTPLVESEIPEQMGIRLSQYESQLEFLTLYYQFSLDFLSLKRIKLLGNLAKFIDWASLSETASRINTRMLANLVERLRGGADSFTTQVITDSRRQMAAAAEAVLKILKDLAFYHREAYKLRVRLEAGPRVSLPDTIEPAKIEAAVGEFRKAFSATGGNLPFYQDLVREIVVEDATSGGQKSCQAILERLRVEDTKAKRVERASHKPILVEAIRILSAASRHLDVALDKTNSNAQTYDELKGSSGSTLFRWLRRVLSKNQKENRIFDVEFVDVATSGSKHEKIDYESFVTKASKYSRSLAAYTNKISAKANELAEASDTETFELLETSIIDMQRIVRVIPALHELFNAELPREVRSKLRGVKLEVNAIKNAVVKANQRRHEYVAQKEEEEQLRKLGVGDAGS